MSTKSKNDSEFSCVFFGKLSQTGNKCFTLIGPRFFREISFSAAVKDKFAKIEKTAFTNLAGFEAL